LQTGGWGELEAEMEDLTEFMRRKKDMARNDIEKGPTTLSTPTRHGADGGSKRKSGTEQRVAARKFQAATRHTALHTKKPE